MKLSTDPGDRPAEHESSNALSLLKADLGLKVKENLTLSRVHTAEVHISIPIQRETYDKFVELVKPTAERVTAAKTVYRATYKNISSFLCSDWWYRIGNKHGDHAFVIEPTITFWCNERRCLPEFVLLNGKLEKKFAHRGYQLVFKFVKDTGNGSELDKLC